jgi:TetR/AcrR family transcriptional repressor of nem operon
MCLCGILAAEYHTLPPRVQAVVLEFFEENERWLEAVLEQGRRDGTLQFAEPAKDAARLVVSALEGAMLVARSYSDARRFRITVGALLKSFAGAA